MGVANVDNKSSSYLHQFVAEITGIPWMLPSRAVNAVSQMIVSFAWCLAFNMKRPLKILLTAMAAMS